MNKKFFFIFLFIIFLNQNLLKADTINVLIIPFENAGDFQLDYLNDIIQNSIFSFLKMTSEYSPVNPANLKEYLKKNKFKKGDLQNINTLYSIASDYNASIIIKGKFYEEENYLIIDFDVIDVKSKKITYRFNRLGKSGFYILESLNSIVKSMVEDFTGIKLDFASVNIHTDYPCIIYIDNEYFGETPIKTNLETGKHHIELYYKNENNNKCILKKEINLVSDETFNLDINVFVNLKIDSEKKCSVYIDNKFAGYTPYDNQIFSGNNYKIKAAYKDSTKEIILFNKELSTHNRKDIKLTLSAKCTMDINIGNNPFKGEINNNEIPSFPYKSENLNPDVYRIKLFIEDQKWNKKFIFYNKKIFLQPYKNENIDLSNFKFKKLYGLCFIPGASQFYNRQNIKGSLFLTFFLTSIAVTALSPVFSYSYYYYQYLPKAYEWNNKGSNGNYSKSDLDNDIQTTEYMFKGFLIGGLISCSIFLIWSLIDGAVNMNRIHKIFYSEKPGINSKLKIKITPAVEIKYCQSFYENMKN